MIQLLCLSSFIIFCVCTTHVKAATQTVYVVTNGCDLHLPSANDLTKTIESTLSYNKITPVFKFSKSLDSTLASIPQNSILLYLSVVDHECPTTYPDKSNPITATQFATIKSKNIRAYVEFPSCVMTTMELSNNITCVPITQKKTTKFERGVVISDKITNIRELSIVDTQQTFWGVFPPSSYPSLYSDYDVLMVMGKFAGYDVAVFGLSGTPFDPLVLEYQNAGTTLLVAMNAMSSFNLARYKPREHVHAVIQYIVNKIVGSNFMLNQIIFPKPRVQPAMLSNPNRTIYDAFVSGINWVFQSNLLLTKPYQSYENTTLLVGQRIVNGWNGGNGTFGMFEGFMSGSSVNGSQMQAKNLRTDCHSEIAAGLSWTASMNASKIEQISMTTSYNLLEYIYEKSGVLVVPQQTTNYSFGAYGILRWGMASYWVKTSYADDSARVILSSMIAVSNLIKFVETEKSNMVPGKFVKSIALAIIGSFRVTSKYGYRQAREDINQFIQDGWESSFNSTITYYDPHYECFLWPIYLYTCEVTGYKEMCDRSTIGITKMMDVFYSSEWNWANGITQEYARMILPLSFLVRFNNDSSAQSKTYKKWLYDVTNMVVKYQNFSQNVGSIEEHYGDLNKGQARPPESNAQYGTGEAPLEQINGDPVSDSLYTCNFALWGLHEAYLATGDVFFKNHRDLLAKFFVNSQAEALDPTLNQLDGGWFRAFDFKKLEFFASSSDIGWGPTSQESGWTVGEVLSAFALINTNQSFWDVCKNMADFPTVVNQMLPTFGL